MIEYYHRYPEKYSIDSYVRNDLRFDSIIAPRMPLSAVKSKKGVHGYLNFHGMITQVPSKLSETVFPTEYGRIIDVQSVCK